jgi:hypothetical protein
MKRLYMSYNHEGFEAAKSFGNDEEFDSTHSLAIVLEDLIATGNHDWFKGICESYQIYNDAGFMVFDSGPSAQLKEVV